MGKKLRDAAYGVWEGNTENVTDYGCKQRCEGSYTEMNFLIYSFHLTLLGWWAECVARMWSEKFILNFGWEI